MWNERRNRAHALYVQSGTEYTLKDVSKLLDINLGVLKTWSAAENWPEKREKYWDFLRRKKELSEQLELKSLIIANQSKDPNDIYKMTIGLIGKEKVELIKQKILQENLGFKPQVDKNFYKDVAQAVHTRLLERFKDDGNKYNALRLIENDIMEVMTEYE